jgi:hypothetical protein
MEGQNKEVILTPETIQIFTGFAATLKKIHVRLIAEGYTITEGKIYKPGEAVPSGMQKKP